MKHQADKHGCERDFFVGDWVYLKLQPCIQQSEWRRTNHKLSFKYFGPYLILQRVDEVAHKLQLPPSSHIHSVVHVSQLKKALSSGTEVLQDSQLQFLSLETASSPPQVLDIRLPKVGSSVTPYALVKWHDGPTDWATWERLCVLATRCSSSAS